MVLIQSNNFFVLMKCYRPTYYYLGKCEMFWSFESQIYSWQPRTIWLFGWPKS